MRLLLSYALLVLISCQLFAGSSPEDEIRKRQAELQAIRDQIRQFEERIKQHQQNESEALELLETYDRKAGLVRRLVGKLRQQEQDLQRKIETTGREMDKLTTQLDFLKKQYAGYVASGYKSGRTHDLELLLTSASLNQFTLRTEYLRRFAAQRKRDADRILTKRAEVEEAQAVAQQQLTDERRLIAEKGAEEDRLTALAAERREVLSQIRKNKKMVQKSIERQTKAAKEIENIIYELIESDRIKRERAADEARKGKLPQPPTTTGNFDTKKGKLRWPVSQGRIVARFGNQRHPTLRTITQNTGIDISVEPGSSVMAVAEGEVSRIWWLPSYGNMVIVNHYNGYRTIYTHLSDIGVAEGQKIKEGEVIGESGEGLDGPRLHFEVWKEKEKQNPEQWLMPQ